MWRCGFIGLTATGASANNTAPVLVGGLASLLLY